MRILFISFNDVTDVKYGGGQCSRRNLELLKKRGTVEAICIRKKSNLESIQSIIFGNFPPLTPKKKKEIISKVKSQRYSLIFLDSSLLGGIGKTAKEIDGTINILAFFHNVEYDYNDVRLKRGLKHSIYKILAKRHEKYSTIYANKIIVLNQRDNIRIKQLYNREADAILPISFEDKYKNIQESVCKQTEKPIALFVGAFGRSNYEGIKWLIEGTKLLNKVKFVIVGKGFEVAKKSLEVYGCSVLGTVEDIAKIYEMASFVVAPILFGGGMKVKIAEALMYGKTVFGTAEALEGYEDDEGNSLYLCTSIEDFDNCILQWIEHNRKMFNSDSRKLFIKKYDVKVVEDNFNQLIKGLGDKLG